jgi:serine/threonine-protein kinase
VVGWFLYCCNNEIISILKYLCLTDNISERFDFMEKFLKWTVLFIVLIILASGGVAFHSVFVADKDMLLMPSFREMSLINAVTDAEQLGLKVRIEQIESRLPSGRVIAQWPEPGTKIRGAEKNIILKVSKSGERRPIPDIRGVELGRATRMLEEQGFTIGDVIRIKDSSSNNIPVGSVIAQSPASPGSIPVNYKVDLLVSEGSEEGKIAVPNVFQMTESVAREMLENAGLKVAAVEKEKTKNKNVIEGQVASTRPAAGALVNKGDGIKLLVSIGADDKTEPTPVNPVNTVNTSFPGRQSAEPDLTDVSVLDQQRRNQNSGVRPERPESTRTGQNDPHSPEFNVSIPGGSTTTPETPSTPAANTGNKVAKIRYQVPPILRPLPLKIEILDTQGKRVLLERNARANEHVQIDGNYTQEAVVSVFLGGEFVWQERFK